MKLKFKVSLLVIAIMAVMIMGISMLLLRRASDTSVNISIREVRYLAVLDGERDHYSSYSPELKSNVEMVVNPFSAGNSGTNWAVMVGSEKTHVLSELRDISRFTMVMAVIAITISALILFIVLGFVISPVVTVTETSKDISGGINEMASGAEQIFK